MSISTTRLGQERVQWRKDHPHGFSAKPKTDNNQMNLFEWECKIPGRKGTDWEGGSFPLSITFPEEYPMKAPICRFAKGFFHPNVFPSGTVCLSLLGEDWKPAITVKQILLGIQELLDSPNENSPAQKEAYHLYVSDKTKYHQKVREQSQRYQL
eukprot:TRINITY_DN6100_c0_g1_i1.p1 TRINITY_DN6100_c0_g1~~TRINITY_DN6100_c0_g1_i1.p1  ORF type:complete len:154 (+),score=27.29 TRINITY_DN6100_c0_g1_i1:56-517(+)